MELFSESLHKPDMNNVNIEVNTQKLLNTLGLNIGIYDKSFELLSFPERILLKDTKQEELIRNLADLILKFNIHEDEINCIYNYVTEEHSFFAPTVKLSASLARSKFYVSKLKETDLSISVIVPMFRETDRLKSNLENPHGENALIQKINQLEWLFSDSSISWRVVLCDDGCDQRPSSSEVAQKIVEDNYLNGKVKIIKLRDCFGDNTNFLSFQDDLSQQLSSQKNIYRSVFERDERVISGLRSTFDSQKAAAVRKGVLESVEEFSLRPLSVCKHITVVTDADLSTHLGQLGTLLFEIINGNSEVVIGTRYSEGSATNRLYSDSSRTPTVNIQNLRYLRAYLIDNFFPELSNFDDIFSGLKVFTDKGAMALLSGYENKFAFDLEFLLNSLLWLSTEQNGNSPISQIPIVWAHSPEASTSDDISSHLDILKGCARIYIDNVWSNNLALHENLLYLSLFILNITPYEYQNLMEKDVSSIVNDTQQITNCLKEKLGDKLFEAIDSNKYRLKEFLRENFLCYGYTRASSEMLKFVNNVNNSHFDTDL